MDQQLLVYITVVEKGNFTRAAEELHMTQPAVSQYIQALERMIGTKLLDRSNKYVGVNKAGEIVYHHAKQILGLYTRMHFLVDDMLQTAGGPLSIGASYTYGEYILPYIIANMRGEYPLIKPTVKIGNTKEIAELVLNHHLDVGIVEAELQHDRLHIEPFADDQMFVLASANHPLLNEHQIEVTDLTNETWIVREEGSGTREATDKMFRTFHIQPDSLMELGSTQIIKESVEAGIGITLLSYWTVRKEIAMGVLKMLNVSGLPVSRKFSLVTLATPFHTKASEVFLDAVRKNTGPAV
ncbi:LysR family transcriptional regulator [Aneurinibacillus sp. Ricciae_BoGa-3]|uniref:LysR family transcriptional regulator n=1 Tax=Aneurinibacillus sp. Ricciae_BoGa-3 TaxID=3022697 RepID=UPI002340F1CC|nr:LysR family transcriptional regulator [Aneurinibacillus sp. Ricciae_BoGa-3]WCK54917.1 LysR family transcriptional regulator [Aneurinibacillus sp. Ricciae_BoGa-3]